MRRTRRPRRPALSARAAVGRRWPLIAARGRLAAQTQTSAQREPAAGAACTPTSRSITRPTASTTTATTGMVTLAGHVEAWQGDRILRADKVTFDRNTGVAAATGNVVLLEPDGAGDVRRLRRTDAGHEGRRAPGHARAAGRERPAGRQRRAAHRRRDQRAVAAPSIRPAICARRTRRRRRCGRSARAPRCRTWSNKRIEYHDAVVDMYGIPVAYLPYFTHPDPSAKRASGMLVPVDRLHQASRRVRRRALLLGDRRPVGRDHHADDRDQQRARRSTSSTAAASTTAPSRINGSAGQRQRRAAPATSSPRASSRSNDTWRWGFDINRASSANYLQRLSACTGAQRHA